MPGPLEPEPARRPAAERAGVRRDDRVVGEQPSEVGDHPAGVDPRTRPVAARRRSSRPPRPRGPRHCSGRGPRVARRRGRPPEPRVGGPQERAGIGTDRSLGRGGEPDGTGPRLEVDVDPALADRRDPVLEGRRLVEARPEDEQRVRRLDPLAHGARAAEAGHPEVQRMVVGDHVATPPAGDHRHVEQLREADEVVGAPGSQDAGAGQDQRALGGGEEVQHRAQVARARCLGMRPDDRHERALGQGQAPGRPRGSPGTTGPGRPSTVARTAASSTAAAVSASVELARPLGQAADGADEVDLLERLAAPQAAVDVTEEHEHRGRVRRGGVDADGEVRGADDAGPEAGRRVGRSAGRRPPRRTRPHPRGGSRRRGCPRT